MATPKARPRGNRYETLNARFHRERIEPLTPAQIDGVRRVVAGQPDADDLFAALTQPPTDPEWTRR